jgi:xylulokinase
LSLFLGLDVGTQSTKGLVVDDERGEVVAEQHPDTWWAAIVAVARELGSTVDLSAVAGVGVSGQQHGFVPVDADGAVIRPAKLWCDTATADEARELSTRFGAPVPTGFTAPKILWLARHEPAAFARLVTVLLPHDWVNLALTGVRATERGDASGTALLDVAAGAWDRGRARAVDERLPDLLPPLVAPDAVLGRVTAEAAAALGLAAGTPVAPGSGDNMLSAIGSGATRRGTATLSLGTSATVFAHAPAPTSDPGGAIASFCDATGGWLPLLCVMNATGVLEEVRAAFGGTHDELAALAEAVPVGCDGVTFVPYLAGERVPDLPDATGALLGLRAGSLRPGVVYRAALEGVALNLAWGLERMGAMGEATAIERANVVGGGARNALWLQVLADALGIPLTPLAEPESAALGAALQALWVTRRAAGDGCSIDEVAQAWARPGGATVTPDPDAHAPYTALRARFRAEVEGWCGA